MEGKKNAEEWNNFLMMKMLVVEFSVISTQLPANIKNPSISFQSFHRWSPFVLLLPCFVSSSQVYLSSALSLSFSFKFNFKYYQNELRTIFPSFM